MNTKYCANCGHPNYYSLALPNLCSNCGSKFNTQSFKPQVFAGKTVKQLPNEAYEHIEDSVSEDADYDGLDIATVEGTQSNRGGIKLGDLAFDQGQKQVFRTIPKLTKKQAQEQVKSLLESAQSDSKRGVMADIPFNEKD